MMENNYLRTFFVTFILLISIVANAQNLIVADGDDIVISGDKNYTTITVQEGGKITFTGDITAEKVYVNTGGLLIVNGSLSVVKNGGDKLAQLIVDGTAIITNNLTVTGNKVADTQVQTNGVLVVGGTYLTDGGNGNGSSTDESSLGDVYLSNPADGSGITGNGVDGDITDLIEAEPPVLPEEILVDFIENSGYVAVDYSWQGDVVGNSYDWDDVDNWQIGKTPSKACNVIIPEGLTNYSNFCSSKVYYMLNLTLENNTTLVIPAGSQVTVFGDVFIGDNAQLTVANSNGHPTSFIIYGDVFKSDGVTPGEITFDWTYNNGNWWFIGHPISNADMSTSYDKIPLLNGGANDYVLYDLEDTDVFTKISKTNFDFSAQSPVKGYLFKVKDDVTPLSLTGYINNDAEYTKTLQNEWQIVANPYPAYYQLPLENATNVDADFYHTTGTVYVTNSTSNSDKVFYTYNTLTGISSPANEIVNGIIAPGQGFYIKTNTPGNIRMRASNRVHAVGTLLKAGGAAAEQNVLRLTLQNESGAKDEAVIAFRENGLTSYSRLDSEKKLTSGSAVSSIYSIKEGLITVMNILPTGIEASIPLGVSAQSGHHQISIVGIQTIDDSYEVVLEDLQTGISTLMDGTSTYECELESGENNERFILHLKKQSVATDVDEPMLVDDAEIYVKNGQELVITCNWDSKVKIISVYSVNGSEVMQEMMNGNTYETLLDLPTGIYIVRLSGIDGVFQKKIMLQ